jgi:thymidine kinase
VIVAALDSDYRREPFGQVCHLVAKSEDVTKLKSVCMFCYGNANFSCRITNETKIKLFGGLDKYMACCRRCYFKNSLVKKREKK